MDTNHGSVLLYLYGGYHSNCNITLAMLDKVSSLRPDVKIIKINTLNNYQIKIDYQVKALPALIYLENGFFKGKITGNLNYQKVLALLNGSD